MKDLTANKMFKKNIVIFYIATIIFILDRLSKYYILELFEAEKADIHITSFLNLHLVFNRGIAFGLFAANETFYYNLITTIIILITFVVLFMALKTKGLKNLVFQ